MITKFLYSVCIALPSFSPVFGVTNGVPFVFLQVKNLDNKEGLGDQLIYKLPTQPWPKMQPLALSLSLHDEEILSSPPTTVCGGGSGAARGGAGDGGGDMQPHRAELVFTGDHDIKSSVGDLL